MDLVPADLDQASCAEIDDLDGFSAYDSEASRDPTDPKNANYPWKGSSYLVICRDRSTMKFTLPLELLEHPPAWGRVDGKADGIPLEGFGCDGIGDRDSGYIEPTATTFLHETFQ